jgi:N-acetyl-gamma-glutamyl-phosphate reductase
VIRTVIMGAGGYAGAELVGLLAAHEDAELVGLFGSDSRAASAGGRAQRFDEVFPRWRGEIDLPIEATSVERVLALRPQAVFLATPHEVSHDVTAELLANDAVVFDLSAAFRLRNAADYPRHYGFVHQHADLLAEAVYGLPERHFDRLRSANLIALPGCYPTSVVLPLAPLVEAGAVSRAQPVIADCTSGVSGAGRTAVLKSLYCEVSYQPYGVLSHRHAPEICLHSGTDVIFTPHLAPFDRGIVSTIHASLTPEWNQEMVRATLQNAYGAEPFVRLLPAGAWPSVAIVRGTNYCDIALAVDDQSRHLIMVSAIDNLLKGAAGQAVQCFNVRFGFPQTMGLKAGSIGGMACTTR